MRVKRKFTEAQTDVRAVATIGILALKKESVPGRSARQARNRNRSSMVELPTAFGSSLAYQSFRCWIEPRFGRIPVTEITKPLLSHYGFQRFSASYLVQHPNPRFSAFFRGQ